MGKIDRLKRITASRIDAFLSSLEKPELILPQLVREMAQQVKEAAAAQAKALTAVKGARRRLDEAIGRAHRFRQGATLAVQANDTQLARQALAAQLKAEQAADQCQSQLESAEKAYTAATAVCQQLSQNLKDLKIKKTELLQKHRHQQLTKEMQSQYARSVLAPDQSIVDAVARMEAKITQQEDELQITDEITQTLGIGFSEERVRQLERDDEVNRRLAQLKEELNQPND